MEKLVRFAVNNPVTISMAVLAILLLGKISYDRLGVDLLPEMNSPRLFVEVAAGERPPEEIEKMFVESMESAAIRQSDVTQVSSVIKAGSARMTVEYAQNKDMDEAFIDLQKALSAFSSNDDITEMTITQHDPNTAPVMLISLSNDNITDMAALRKMAESYIRNELVRLEGVAEVSLSGEEESQLIIETDRYKLNAFGLTVDNISSRIEANNQSLSGGRVSELGLQYLVKSSSLFTSEADFENLIVGYKAVESSSSGSASTASSSSDAASATTAMAPIFLRDVATVKFENARPTNIVRINGERCIGLSVYKETQYNTVKAVDLISRQLKTIQQSLPGYKFRIITNHGTFISNAVGEVKDSALMGMALAVLVLFLFLRRIGTTLIVSLSIPISIIATFNMMYFGGLTLNVMTLSGLALGGGMLVDNAIVVIESIFRNQERGLARKDAIVTGTSEVSGAIIASTLTTIVVFLPIVYIHGASGELFRDQAWTVAFSLLSSLFVAMLAIPMMYDQLSGRKKTVAATDSIRMEWYSGLLRSLLRRRWAVIGVSVALFGLSLFLIPFIGTEFMPRSESRTFSVAVKLPEGTRMERTDALVCNLENMLYAISADTACTIYSHVGEGSSENEIFEGEHTALMKVTLSPACPYSPEKVIERFSEQTENIEGLELAFKQDDNFITSFFSNDDSPIIIEVKGESIEEIADISEEVMDKVAGIDGLYNVMSSIEDGAPEVEISINRTIAGINNISVSTVISQLEERLEGRDVGKMDYHGEMRSIVIKVPDVTLSELNDVVITNNDQEFQLREIAAITQKNAPKEIFRRNQSRINKIHANINAGKSLDKMADEIRSAVSGIELPSDYSITVTGEEEQRKESINSLLFALLLSVVLVYMVLASQYESLLHPFTILLTVPLSVTGAIFLFFLTGTTINIMGVIGIVMLVGIAVNNSILLVGRIIQLKQEGAGLPESIVQAGQQRIRPIIMTSLTTILALLPLTFSFGEGASMRASMAIAVIGGLVTSVLMSLIVIPCVYYVFERMKTRVIKNKK